MAFIEDDEKAASLAGRKFVRAASPPPPAAKQPSGVASVRGNQVQRIIAAYNKVAPLTIAQRGSFAMEAPAIKSLGVPFGQEQARPSDSDNVLQTANRDDPQSLVGVQTVPREVREQQFSDDLLAKEFESHLGIPTSREAMWDNRDAIERTLEGNIQALIEARSPGTYEWLLSTGARIFSAERYASLLAYEQSLRKGFRLDPFSALAFGGARGTVGGAITFAGDTITGATAPLNLAIQHENMGYGYVTGEIVHDFGVDVQMSAQSKSIESILGRQDWLGYFLKSAEMSFTRPDEYFEYAGAKIGGMVAPLGAPFIPYAGVPLSATAGYGGQIRGYAESNNIDIGNIESAKKIATDKDFLSAGNAMALIFTVPSMLTGAAASSLSKILYSKNPFTNAAVNVSIGMAANALAEGLSEQLAFQKMDAVNILSKTFSTDGILGSYYSGRYKPYAPTRNAVHRGEIAIIDPSVFSKAGLDPVKELGAIKGIDPERVEQAVREGKSFGIPIDAFEATIGLSRNRGPIFDNIRLKPDQLTVAEERTFNSSSPEVLAQVRELVKGSSNVAVPETAKQLVETPTYNALIKAGYPADKAREQATIYALGYDGIAARMGVSIQQLLKLVPLGAGSLERPAKHWSPARQGTWLKGQLRQMMGNTKEVMEKREEPET